VEVSIDFADYAEATTISLVSLPIKNSLMLMFAAN
jgi:hypothetical protein